MKVEYHSQSVDDLNTAIAYYNKLRPNLGDALRNEVYTAIARIVSNPARYPVIEHGVRRCFIHRFPYSILYRLIELDRVRILVIRHHRRQPDFGQERR